MGATDWRDGVRVVRGGTLQDAMAARGGRATAVDFANGGERGVWIGTVRLDPLGNTGKHHHGRHNMDTKQAVEYVVIRSDNERIAVKLDGGISDNPQTVY